VTPLPSVFAVSTLADFVGVVLQSGGLEGAVENATGVVGLLIIAAYSFLIAVVLPLPSEVVLVAAETGLGFGLPSGADLALVVLVSGLAKAAGSLVAFHLGHEAQRRSGPIIDRLRDSRFDIVEWSERRTIQLAQEYGYIGLALALMVPFFPDTLSIYAFTVLEENYTKFAAATFAGSAGRLLLVAGVLAPFFSLFGI
jgi:membrane protein YqaA with SNARE-associated domain